MTDNHPDSTNRHHNDQIVTPPKLEALENAAANASESPAEAHRTAQETGEVFGGVSARDDAPYNKYPFATTHPLL
jgi:hypothetical protein